MTKLEGSMSEEYLLQEVMRMLYDRNAQFVDFASRVGKEEEDKCVTCICFYDF